jgi:hypothetical protein
MCIQRAGPFVCDLFSALAHPIIHLDARAIICKNNRGQGFRVIYILFFHSKPTVLGCWYSYRRENSSRIYR